MYQTNTDTSVSIPNRVSFLYLTVKCSVEDRPVYISNKTLKGYCKPVCFSYRGFVHFFTLSFYNGVTEKQLACIYVVIKPETGGQDSGCGDGLDVTQGCLGSTVGSDPTGGETGRMTCNGRSLFHVGEIGLG